MLIVQFTWHFLCHNWLLLSMTAFSSLCKCMIYLSMFSVSFNVQQKYVILLFQCVVLHVMSMNSMHVYLFHYSGVISRVNVIFYSGDKSYCLLYICCIAAELTAALLLALLLCVPSSSHVVVMLP